jgi:hypothetical protein
MSRKSFIPIIAAAVALTLAGLTQLLGQTRFSNLLLAAQTATMDNAKQQSNVAEEVPLPEDSREREARLAKNARYNGGGCDLTQGEDCFMEQYEPRALPLIPLAQGAIAFRGQVSKLQSYLSADRTHVYTETTWKVDEVFKQPKDFKLALDGVITDQMGGALKLRSGRIATDNTRNGFMGKPYVGGRYVVFLETIHKGEDITMIRAYELRNAKVFKLTEDGTPGSVVLSNKPNQPDSLSGEETFLQAVRSDAAKESGSNLSESTETLDPKTGNLHLAIPLVASMKSKQ